MAARILVLDYGTSALKAVLYDEQARALGVASREWVYAYPAPGRIEHPAQLYWQKTVEAVNELLDRCGGRRELLCVSVTGQAETLIPLDGDGEALGEAIVWLDTRAQEECERFSREIPAAELYRNTGNTGFDPVMPLLKLAWMRRHEPERYRAARKFLLIKEYIVYRLTGEVAGEYTAQSCSGYFDIVRCDWERSLLRHAGIDEALLPPLYDSQHVVGELCPQARRLMNLGAGVKVVNGVLDQCSSALGAGVIDASRVSETTGTVLAVAAALDRFDGGAADMLVLKHALPGKYLALPNCSTAGALLKWFRDCLGAGEDYEQINRAIEAQGREQSGLLFLPHFAGYLSPVNNPRARGVIYGMSLDTTRYDIAHAIMEGVAMLLRENLELLEWHQIRCERVISLGGGARSALWLRIKANVCARSIVTLEDDESTARGCAFNAMLALGMLRLEDISGLARPAQVVQPDARGVEVYRRKYENYRALNARLGFNPPQAQLVIDP